MNKIHIDCPTTKWSFSHLTAQIFSSSREALLVAERHDRLVTQFAESSRVRSDFFQNSHWSIARPKGISGPRRQTSSVFHVFTSNAGRQEQSWQVATLSHTSTCWSATYRLVLSTSHFGVGLGLLGEQGGERPSPRRSATWFTKSIGTRRSRSSNSRSTSCQLCLSAQQLAKVPRARRKS